MNPETDLEKFKTLFNEVGIGFTPGELLNNTVELRINPDALATNDKYTIVAVFEADTGKFVEFESF